MMRNIYHVRAHVFGFCLAQGVVAWVRGDSIEWRWWVGCWQGILTGEVFDIFCFLYLSGYEYKSLFRLKCAISDDFSGVLVPCFVETISVAGRIGAGYWAGENDNCYRK